jgi:nanoRNase/pAp phosphatase (c-di-AMP/oligoRNAs hydrolase)
MAAITDLINCAKKYKSVYIQTHNFPDHDALAAAFGMKTLLGYFGVESHIIYDGDITRASLANMVKKLGIAAHKVREIDDAAGAAVIMVDGCRGNKNMKELKNSFLIGVVDHHDTSHVEDIPFIDIRPACGSCSTIIYTYFEALAVPIDRVTATALMIGLCVDTAILMRNITSDDVKAYFSLFSRADNEFVQSMVRNCIEAADLSYFKYAIENIKIEDGAAFCFLKNGCSQNLLGIMADFFLALEEVVFVMLCAEYEGKVIFSLRSENKDWNAANIIQELLNGRGFGGGHHNMAGGVINAPAGFDAPEMFRSLKASLGRAGGVQAASAQAEF